MSRIGELMDEYINTIKAGDRLDGIIMDRLRELELRGAYIAGYKAALEAAREMGR